MKKIIFPQIPLENVKGVLIDLDDTLYSFEDANLFALQKVYTQIKSVLRLSFDDFYSLYKKHWTHLFGELGTVPSAHCRHTMFQRLMEEEQIEKPYLWAQKLENTYFKNLLKGIKPDPRAVDFLKACRRRRIPVCLVTDLYGSIQVQKLKRLKLIRYIDYVVANDEVGIDKPHADMFLRALEKIKVAPKDAVMIGDNFEKDIQGAQALGIRAYQVTFDK